MMPDYPISPANAPVFPQDMPPPQMNAMHPLLLNLLNNMPMQDQNYQHPMWQALSMMLNQIGSRVPLDGSNAPVSMPVNLGIRG